jgi:uncharacterized protein YkwD
VTRIVRRAAIAAAFIAVPLATVAGIASAANASAPVTSTATTLSAPVEQAVGGAYAYEGKGITVTTVKKKKKAKKKSTAKVTTPRTTAPKPTPTKTTEAGDASFATLEAQVITLTNNQRVANGCGALRTDSRLTAAARAHSADMVTNNMFSHTGTDGSDFVARETRAGYSAASAENIAWGYPTAQAVVDGWMNSPGHRANILNCGSVAVGVGVAKKADGTLYYTQDFGRS